MADLLDPYVLRDRIEFACAEKNPVFKGVYGKDGFDPQKLYDDYTRYGEVLADRITNGTILINEQCATASACSSRGPRARCSTSTTGPTRSSRLRARPPRAAHAPGPGSGPRAHRLRGRPGEGLLHSGWGAGPFRRS